jgi:signal transduction histidine kinase/ribosome-associated protein YbcJ (S4-like RNA binding protein)
MEQEKRTRALALVLLPVLALYLLTAGVLVRQTAKEKRQAMVYTLNSQMVTLLDQAQATALTAIGQDETTRVTIYQKILHSFLDYPMEEAGALLDDSQLDLRLGVTTVQADAVPLDCFFLERDDGSVVTLVFDETSDEDLAVQQRYLLYSDRVPIGITALFSGEFWFEDENGDTTQTYSFGGYWADGLFHIRRISMDLSGPVVLYQDGRGGEEAELVAEAGKLTRAPVYGRLYVAGRTAPEDLWSDAAAASSETQALAEVLLEILFTGEDLATWAAGGDLFHTTWYTVDAIADPMAVTDLAQPTVSVLVYARFSPVSMALGDLLPTLLGLLAVFGLGAAVLAQYFIYRTQQLHDLLRTQQETILQQNRTIDYNKSAETARREMVSAIAHELKTPLAILRTYNEALEENIDEGKRPHYQAVIRQEVDSMDAMVLQMLDLSRLESGKYQLNRSEFSLEEAARRVVAELQPDLDEKQLRLRWDCDSDTTVRADRYRMEQVVRNYLTNAIRHTPPAGSITVAVKRNFRSGDTTLTVANQGDPVPPDQLPLIWDSFYQGDRSRHKRGTGLGLAIVKNVMTLHGGTYDCVNTATGVEFTATLPGRDAPLRIQARTLVSRPVDKTENRIDYPIGMPAIPLRDLMVSLGLLSAVEARQLRHYDRVTVDGAPVTATGQKIRVGQVVRVDGDAILVLAEHGYEASFLHPGAP